jgi:hypothetical protein
MADPKSFVHTRRKAIMKTAGKLSLAFLIMGFAGCAYHQVAEPLPLAPALLAGVRGGGNITFVNAQPSTEDVEVGLAGLGRSLHGNLHQWTEAAINLIQAALTTPPDSAGSSPARVVVLSITRAELSSAGGGWGFKCKVHLDISIDNNQALAFEGERGSWRFPRVCDAAITEAVSNMLKNDTVRNYLTQ